MDVDTRRHLEKVEQELERQYSSLSADAVRSEVERISQSLLTTARFPDFVPLLTRRFARDELDRLAGSA
jgi:hypothetical protein